MVKNVRYSITKNSFKTQLKKYIITAKTEKFDQEFKYFTKRIFLSFDDLINGLSSIFENRYKDSIKNKPLRYYNIYQFILDKLLHYNNIFITLTNKYIPELKTTTELYTVYYKKI